MAMLILALTYPYTSEYRHCHFLERIAAMHFRNAVASLPLSPSAEIKNDVKWQWAWREGSSYFFFFSHSCFSRTFEGGREPQVDHPCHHLTLVLNAFYFPTSVLQEGTNLVFSWDSSCTTSKKSYLCL
jgi:hypothetical protein